MKNSMKLVPVALAFAASVWTSCQSEQKQQSQTDTIDAHEPRIRSEEDLRKEQAAFFKDFYEHHNADGSLKTAKKDSLHHKM